MRLLAALLLAAVAGAPNAQESFFDVEAGVSSERLSGGRDPWKSAYLEAARQFAPRQTLYGGVRETERFGLRDTEYALGYSQPLAAKWTAVLEGTYSPKHNVLPKESVSGSLSWAAPEGWVLSGGARRSEYAASTVNLFIAGIERYWSTWRAGYTLYNAHPEGAGSATAHRVALDYYYAERSRIGISAVAGREVENQGPPTGIITTDVRAFGVGGRHWLTGSWAATWDAWTQRQGDLYRRSGARLGLRYRF